MEKIVIATNNKEKLREIRQILNEYELLSLKEIGINIKVDEDEKTFEKNALKKAKEVFKITNIPCIADDSGLCIDILDGWPGIETARFLGEKASQKERNNYILEKMKGKKEEERNAKIICDIAYIDKNNEILVEGILKGKIANKEKGSNGFGFDTIFELEEGRTLAELTDVEKNKISSRKIALEKLNEKLKSKK